MVPNIYTVHLAHHEILVLISKDKHIQTHTILGMQGISSRGIIIMDDKKDDADIVLFYNENTSMPTPHFPYEVFHKFIPNLVYEPSEDTFIMLNTVEYDMPRIRCIQ